MLWQLPKKLGNLSILCWERLSNNIRKKLTVPGKARYASYPQKHLLSIRDSPNIHTIFYFLIKCSPKIGCRFAKLHWYSFHLCLLCTTNSTVTHDPLSVYAESASAPLTDHWVKQHKLTLIFCTDVLWVITQCVIPAIVHQKCFLFQIFQIASDDAKNIYFTKIYVYSKSNCVNIANYPQRLNFRSDKFSAALHEGRIC